VLEWIFSSFRRSPLSVRVVREINSFQQTARVLTYAALNRDTVESV